jgi:hydroxypyruvate isomerase
VRTYGARFDVNCSILFTELPLARRAAAAAACGFGGVEFWWPWARAEPTDAEADAFVRSIREAGVELVSLNFYAGDLAAGERGILSHPGRAAEFRRNIEPCVEIARRAGCTRLNAPYGRRLAGLDHDTQDAVAVANLRLAAEAAGRVGASVLVEAINSVDAPGFPVDTSARAMALIEAVQAPNVRFLADLYHLATMGEDVAGALHRCRDAIAHVQLADPPGRGAPGTGTLAVEPLFAQLAADGYDGWIGLEYLPSDPADSAGSFGWIERAQR